MLKIDTGKLVWLHLGALFAVLAWGSSFVATKVLLSAGFQPTEIYVYRTLLAYVVILAFAHKRLFARSLRDELLLLVCGLCAGSLYFISENIALQYTLTTNVSLISSMSPLLTTLLIGAVYSSERPGSNVYLGSIIALVGAGLVIFNSSVVLKVNPLGDLLALCSALSWAMYSLVLRRLGTFYTATFITRKTFFYGMLTALVFLIFEPQHTSLTHLFDREVIFNFLFLGLVCSLLAFVVWAWVNNGLGAIRAQNYLYFTPVVTLIVSWIILSEEVTVIGYAGCALIHGGVWFSDRGNPRPASSH